MVERIRMANQDETMEDTNWQNGRRPGQILLIGPPTIIIHANSCLSLNIT